MANYEGNVKSSTKRLINRVNRDLTYKLSSLATSTRGVLVAAVVFGAIGTYILTDTRAATPSASFEPESATVTAPVAAVNDTTASNSQAVVFSPATTPPGGSADACTTYPALPAQQPNTSNTGVPAGTTLSAYTGSLTISTAGTVIDSKVISGDLKITANNVTIKNSRITGGGYYVVQSNASSGVKLLHNEIISSSGGNKYIGVLGKYEFICGNYIHGFENAISMYDGGATIQANLIDKMDGAPTAHHDGIEIYGGSNYKIWGNTIKLTNASGNGWLTETGAINISDDSSVINDVEINGNWLGGGSYTVYVDDQFGYSLSNIKLINNTWLGNPPKGYAGYGPLLIRSTGTVTTNTGNKWENGQAL